MDSNDQLFAAILAIASVTLREQAERLERHIKEGQYLLHVTHANLTELQRLARLYHERGQ